VAAASISDAVFDLIVFVLFIAAPFGLGARTRSYWSALAPVALMVFAIAQYRAYEPSGDEIDALPLVFMLGSGLGVLACLTGAAFGRRYRPPADRTS
jgi:malonyl CoA-acyl carrier protein transacylase